MSQIHPLFSTPVYTSFLNPADMGGVIEYAKNCSYLDLGEGSVTYTDKFYIIDDLPIFKKSITEKVNDYFLNYLKLNPSLKYYFPDSWFVKCGSMCESKKHSHANSLFSGVVYIDAENKGDITFYRPNSSGSSLGASMTLLPYDDHNIFNSDSWVETSNNGKIIIFPSFLEHQIAKNFSKDDRYSFAFNILLENYRCNLDTAKILDR